MKLQVIVGGKMIPFLILLLVPIVIQHVKIKGIDYSKKNQFALTIFFVGLTVLVMLRHESVGNDTANYIYYFRKYSKAGWLDLFDITTELGFTYFNKLVSLVSLDAQFFLGVTAIITSGLLFPTYKRLCVDATLTMVLFCIMSTFVLMFSGVRQMLAISVGFIAYDFARRKKRAGFFLCVIIAMTIHVSAFMLLFMYPLYHARITKKWLYVVVPIMGGVFVFNKQIFAVLLSILARFSRFEGMAASTGAYTMLLLFVLFALFAFLIPDEKQLDDETIGLRNYLLLAIAVQLFAPLHTLAMRMNYYYIIFIPLLIPRIVALRSKRWSQVAIIGRHVMVAFFLLYFFTVVYRSGVLHVFPYHFFWENV